MNKLAEELNEIIKENNPRVLDMLSRLGQRIYFPKGILSQTAEAKEKANVYNATIGIALEKGIPMHLNVLKEMIPSLSPKEMFPYAPASGYPDLRNMWREKQIKENPKLKGKSFSKPIVTSAITHGLSLVGDMFVDQGDVILLPDKLWGNYRLIYEVRNGAAIRTFPMFNNDGGFNTRGFTETMGRIVDEKGKIIVILNFPNNPTGYTPSVKEAEEIQQALLKQAEKNVNIVLVFDDAYFSLFYEDSIKSSMFENFADAAENILAIKLDGATKENFVWGYRVGFLTYSIKAKNQDALYMALEKKTAGMIRGSISNSPMVSQAMVAKALASSDYDTQKNEKVQILKSRANKVKEVLSSKKYDDVFVAYPFNSGYFMCIRLKHVNAEELRLRLLDRYGIGTISIGDNDLRIAFSCVEIDNIEDLFDKIYEAAKDLM